MENATVVPATSVITMQHSLFATHGLGQGDSSVTNIEGLHNATGVPQLAAWPLSGKSVDQEDFQKQLQGYSQLPGGTRQPPVMTLSSNVGIAGVRNDIEIPLGAL